MSFTLSRYEADVNLQGSMSVTKMDEAERLSIVRTEFSIKQLLIPITSSPTKLTSLIVKSTVALFCEYK